LLSPACDHGVPRVLAISAKEHGDIAAPSREQPERLKLASASWTRVHLPLFHRAPPALFATGVPHRNSSKTLSFGAARANARVECARYALLGAAYPSPLRVQPTPGLLGAKRLPRPSYPSPTPRRRQCPVVRKDRNIRALPEALAHALRWSRAGEVLARRSPTRNAQRRSDR